tara:strand:+ start:749 stop:3160 length:2412 start_codon:yes stop_codon:yes gene_type:complete
MINKLIYIIFLSMIFSQNESITILKVDVEGNQRLSREDIIRNSRLYEGMKVGGTEIQQAIKRLWKLNRFNNIQILIEDETLEGIHLKIIVEEHPMLGNINFEGKKKKSERSLMDELNLEKGQILSNYDVFEATKKIREIYAKRNYHNLEVESILSKGEQENYEDLTFKIKTGKKSRIKSISFSGNNFFSDKKLANQFEENKTQKWYFPWSGTWKKESFETDKAMLIEFYKNKGYRDFYIVNETIELIENKTGYNIHLDVYEGPQYKIRNITWGGNYIHSDTDLSHRLNFNKGDIFIENKFNLAISESVSSLYTDKGYFYFQIIPNYTPIKEDSLDIHFEIVENQIVHIRKIDIYGNDKTHENVILRELRVFPGDIFNRKKIMDSYRDIFMLNFFENVVPDIVPINDDEIDLQFNVVEKNTGQANLSMGYNGMQGFTGGGGFEFPNFRGKGQNLSISYQRGLSSNSNSASTFGSTYSPNYTQSNSNETYQSFSISFTEPWLFDTPNLVGGSYYYTARGQGQYSYLPFDTQQQGGTIRWGRRFKWPDYFFRGSWMIRYSNYKYIANHPDDFKSGGFDTENITILENDGDYSFSSSGLSITQTITRDSRNHPEFPTSGSKSIWTSTISGGFLGGNHDYHKHVFDFNYFTPLHNKFTISQIFKAGILGKMKSKNNYSIIPPSTKFIMGGTGIPYGEMLRGYTENRVGPYSTRGGNIMLKYSLEFRLSLSNNPTIYGLTFFEMGNVWSNINNLDPFDLKRSAGFGIRIFIPMLGMLGYDIGYGFDYTDYDNSTEPHGWEYHLIFGMPF